MNCPYCGGDSRVVDSRPLIDSIRRRRECPQCQRRFTTYERYAPSDIRVAKRGGRQPEEFEIAKLIACLEKVTRGCAVTHQEIAQLAREIEAEIVDQGKTQIQSLEIASVVARKLNDISDLAFRRFSLNYVDETGTSSLVIKSGESPASRGEDGAQYLLFEIPRHK